MHITDKNTHSSNRKHLNGGLPVRNSAVGLLCPAVCFQALSPASWRLKWESIILARALKIWKLLIGSSELLIKDGPLFVKSQPNYQMSTWVWVAVGRYEGFQCVGGDLFIYFFQYLFLSFDVFNFVLLWTRAFFFFFFFMHIIRF